VTEPSDIAATVHGLFVHPIKSCGAIAVRDALLVETGFDLDRAWMVADEHGDMLTQRELPRMALIHPTLRGADMVLRAPGMLALHVLLDTVEAPTRARVWDDEVKAYDMGDLAAQWFTDFLQPGRVAEPGAKPGSKLRLLRFDPEQKRLASRQWTGEIEAETAFADGFPLLVSSTASLAELNRRLAAAGHAPVAIERFRPNIVLDGVEAFDEDHIDTLEIDTAEGPVVLKLVKPCVRCSIPDVNPATAETSHAVADTLATFRADPRMNGGLTFGMNAVVVKGLDCTLRAGQAVRATYRFD
jgi:uncharacterized protein